MPELPEVEYTARQLRATVVGLTIQEAQVFWERIVGHPDVADFQAEIAGRVIEGVRRRGKYLLIDLSGGVFLTIHRRMTGNFYLLPPGWSIDTSLRETDPTAWSTKGPTFVAPVEEYSTQERSSESVTLEVVTHPLARKITLSQTHYCRICFTFTDGQRLLFTDPRKFGRVELWPCEREAEALGMLGPEPLSEGFTVEGLQAALAKRKTSIKQVLLDQEIVAGIGNIYADETLFYAAIHPLRRANSLTPAEVTMLREGIVTVLTGAIEHGGTSFNDYRDLWGEAGENYNHVNVYQREGLPCVRCGTPIERIVLAQRSTHYCPHCQPESVPIEA